MKHTIRRSTNIASRRLFRLLTASGVLATSVASLSAANLTWDADTGTAGIQEGDGVWTSSSLNFWTGSANATPIKGTDAIIFGSGSGTGGTVTINNGGSILNYGDATSNSLFTFNRNYTIAGATATDGLSTGNTVINGSTVTISAVLSTNGSATLRNWDINNGGTLNLSGGGNLQIFRNQSGAAGTVNISGGSWSGLTSSWGGGGGVLVVNHTGGTITSGFNIGGNLATSASTSATFNLNGGTVNIAAGTNVSTGASNSANVGNSTINIISGTFTVGGEIRVGNDGGKGTMNISGGTVTGTRAVIGRRPNINAALNNSLNISGGTTTFTNIQFDDSNALNSGWFAGSTGTLDVSGGTLYVGAGGISRLVPAGGASANFTPIINLSGGTVGAVNNWSTALDVTLAGTGGGVTFRAADSIGATRTITLTGNLGGSGDFTKTGIGTLFLNGTKSFTGNVYINAGTVSSNSVFIADSADLFLLTGSTLNLNFSGSDSISRLFIDGVQQNAGLYSSGNLASFISGAGSLNVLTSAIPEPSATALLVGFGALGLAARRRRRVA